MMLKVQAFLLLVVVRKDILPLAVRVIPPAVLILVVIDG